ncbi:hypothetical protein [Piscibacillus salipiscarius]|uniref:aldose epimerase family protein n=1 Tax=Piscibacillus salipiscarius TaxID=299480 RepID=UPI0024373FD2|nr:hypothetical protein [Piscibacillus salipiscarius]
MEYEGHPNQETPIALTNHTYFNLTGNAKQTAENHHVTFTSSKMLELNSDLIPTGQLLDASNTFDFTQGRTLKEGMLSKHEQHQIAGGGYDHYFIFDENPTIQVVEPQSGRRLLIETNQPGMILYSGNNIDDQVQVNQQTGKKYLGVCFETQAHPASLHGAPLPPILTSQRYYQRTTYTVLTS